LHVKKRRRCKALCVGVPRAYATPMLDIVLYVLLLLISLAAVALNVVSLPGNWVILAAALGLSIYHGGRNPHWGVLLVILVVLVAAEVLELISGLIGTRKFGGSKTAAWAAVGGAMIGGLVGVPPLTVPLLGIDHLVMAVVGAFAAAWIVELLKKKQMKEALLAALGAALGRGAGLAAKIGAGLMAWFILLGWWVVALLKGW
jgi:uncharacterized protein YqgC (DUF456 family)